MEIINFFDKIPIKNIESEFKTIISSMTDYCDKIIGKGYVGEVKINKIGERIKIKINKIIIDMPVVIKRSNINGTFKFSIINDIIYMSSFRDITAEAIILCYVSRLWYKKITPHLPFMIGINKCNIETPTYIDQIITEKAGLDEPININYDGFIDPAWDNKWIPDQKSTLATLADLFSYIIYNKRGNYIKLPGKNKDKCDIIELLDSILISYLHTAHILFDTYKISLSDMHPFNIFIHWLNKNSYMGDKFIGDVDTIIYKIGSKYIQINTFGIIVKLGDLGTCVLHPRSDIYIIGQMEKEPDSQLMKYYDKENYQYALFLFQYMNFLPYEIFSQTIAYKIITTEPFNKIYNNNDITHPLLKFPTPEKLLNDEMFAKYHVKKIKSNKNTLVL